MAFDPDEYLKEPAPTPATASKGFDPDEYLAAPTAQVPLPAPRPEEAPSMTPAVAAAPLPRERPEGAPPRPEPAATPPVVSLEGAEPPPEPGAIARGFTTGSLKENPKMGAAALEMAAHLGPSDFKESLMSASRDLYAVAERSPAAYATKSKGLWNIGSLEDLDTYVGETLGQALSSSLPSAATGAVGAFVGGRAAGKVGAIGGGVAGALGPSYGLNSGEIYTALKEAGVSGEAAAPWAATAGAMTTALDVASLGTIVGVFGAKKVKSELNKELATRIATAVAAGAGTESVTEMFQDVIKHASVSLKAGKPFWTEETGKAVIESGVGGAIGGSVLGGGVGAAKTVLPSGQKVGPEGVPIPEQEQVTPADIEAQVAAGGIQVSPPVADPGGPTQPLPSNTPVTTEQNGVKTTTTVHGAAGAYEVAPDETGKPTMKPTMSPGEWIDKVNNEATTLYPDVIGPTGEPVISPQAMAFENGAHGYPVHQGLPLDTPIDTVMEAYDQGQDYASTPSMPMAAEREGQPVQGLYSRLQSWVQEKGPPKLPAHEWLAKLKGNNAFKTEEVQDLQLEAYLEGRKGQTVTKQELLDHATAMTAPLIEVTRIPLSKEEKATKQKAIEQQIFAIAQADPTARDLQGRPNLADPRIAPLVDQITNMHRSPEWAQFEAYTTPGPRDSYTELTLHLPRRGDTTKPASVPIGTVKVVGEDTYGSHYAEPNEVVSIRLTRRTGINGEQIAVLEEGQSDVLQALKAGAEVPGMVYQQGWPALGVTRFLMWAAQNGITHIAWTNSAEQMRRYPKASRGGMEHFYDKVVPGIMKKWARDLGGTMTTAMIPDTAYVVRPWSMDPNTGMVTQWGVFDPRRTTPIMTAGDQITAEEYAQRNTSHSLFQSVQLPQSALDTINMGMPSYSREDETATSPGAELAPIQPGNPRTVAAGAPLVGALNSLIKKLKLGIKVRVRLHDRTIEYKLRNPRTGLMETVRKNSLGVMQPTGVSAGNISSADIHVAVGQHASAEGLWATMVHEVGHLVMVTTFKNVSDKVKTAIFAAHQEFYKKTHPDISMEELLQLQSNAAFLIERVLRGDATNTLNISQLSAEKQAYWRSFEEWFAEQVAKWATSSEPALSHVEKFFKGIADTLRLMLKTASQMFGMRYEAVPELQAFLDSFLKSDIGMVMGPQISVQTTQSTTVKNATQMAPEDMPAAAQVETAVGMDGINGVFDGRPPAEAKEAKAYADKFTYMWKVYSGIHHLARANRHIRALQEYVETIRVAEQLKKNIQIQGQEVLRKWNKLGETQADNVSKLLDEVQYMNYLTPTEKAQKVTRHPTQAELFAMARRLNVSKAGLAVYAEVGKSFQDFLTRWEAVAKEEAMKIPDQVRQALALAGITKHMIALRSKPYFPSMRFGSYTLVIRNAAKQVIHFETFETQRQRRSAMRAIQGSYGVAGDQMEIGFLDKSVRPLLGVPTQILEMMQEKLKLNQTQKDALAQLKFELSPVESFRHRFQHKKLTAGYSMDFRRAYANYFFHGGNHLAKAQYADRLRALTKMAKAEATPDPVTGILDITKREKITAQMANHTEHWLDPKPDWAMARSIAFLYSLSFSVAAAGQNLTQTMLTTHPFLSNKFGYTDSIVALANAARGLENFYRKRTLEKHTNFGQKAIFQGMEDGHIKETQAPELAGYADGDILGLGFGGNKAQRAWVKFNEWGAFMFEMSEQFNRRLVFRAALDLAMKNPGAKYVREVVARSQLTYQKRRSEGWTEAEASAYVVAIDAVSETQFEYGKEFAPRVFRGKARAFLVFKTFQQSYFMYLLNNPGARIQSLITLAILAGFMGLPFSAELRGMLNILAYWLYGKDFKIDHEARKMVIELLGQKEGDWVADILMHGIAKKGFGIPAFMDMIGGTVGVDVPAPVFDRSSSISTGTFLPIELEKLLGPPLQSPEKAIAQQSQRASGALFGVGFSVYSALRDTQLSWNDAKKWEALMPRALRNVSQAYRAGTEGGSRTKTGGMIVEYDVRDPQQAAEVIGMGMGYVPYRQNYEWEKAMAKSDAAKMVDIRREQIMRQWSNAMLGGDAEEKAKMRSAVTDFNRGLEGPERAKAITSESLEKSVEKKATDRAVRAQGLSPKTSDIPIYRDVEEKLFPGSNRTLTKVKPALRP